MRVLVIGGSGQLGTAVADALSERHDVLRASRSSGIRVDVTDEHSVRHMWAKVGRVDAVACAAGKTPFAAFDELPLDQIAHGMHDKFLGQVSVVKHGLEHVSDGGSFTLISGVLADTPIRTGVAASAANGAINTFVKAAAIELPRGQRINAVSPTVFEESWAVYGAFFAGHQPVPVAEAAQAYVTCIEGSLTGRIIQVGY